MAKSQENGATILLGLKGYEVRTVTEGEGKIIVEVRAQQRKPVCPHCSSVKLYRHGSGKRRRVLHSWSNGKKVYLELCCQRAGDAGTVVALLMTVQSYCDLIQG